MTSDNISKKKILKIKGTGSILILKKNPGLKLKKKKISDITNPSISFLTWQILDRLTGKDLEIKAMVPVQQSNKSQTNMPSDWAGLEV